MSVGILCDRVWKGYYVTNRKRGTKLHEEKSIQGSIALHIANLCRILILGMSYGFLMRSMGSPCWINIKMSDGKVLSDLWNV